MNYKLPSAICVVFAHFSCQSAESELLLAYHSQYISEARLVSNEAFRWLNLTSQIDKNYSLEISYGNSKETDEFSVSAYYQTELNQFNLYAGLSHFQFFKDNENDNELIIGVEYQATDLFVPFIEAVYSLEANAWFIESGFNNQLLNLELLSLNTYVIASYDNGYADENYQGYNSSRIGAVMTYQMMDSLSVIFQYEKNWIGTHLKQADLTNQDWFGLSLGYQF